MFFDVDNTVLAVAKSFGGVLSTQAFDERLCTASNLLGELNHVDAFQYDVVRLHRVRTRERRTAAQSQYIAPELSVGPKPTQPTN